VTQSAGGWVTGNAKRYSAGGALLGVDCWLANDAGTRLIGLTGPEYEYNKKDQNGTVTGVFRSNGEAYNDFPYINAAGQVAATSARYSSTGGDNGRDAWLFDGNTTRLIGLTGPDYEYQSSDGTIGRYNEPSAAPTASGSVLGWSSGPHGSDTWVYSNGTTRRVGLTGGIYENATHHRQGSGAGINNAGQSIGVNNLFQGYSGQDCWFNDGTASHRINLTGGVYEYTDSTRGNAIVRGAFPTELNESGDVIGWSWRYSPTGDSLGSAGWFYDSTTDVTTELAFGVRADLYCATMPLLLTETGVVLGSYKLSDATTGLNTRAFWWSASEGFHDLGELVSGGLPDAGWQYLTGFNNNIANDAATAGVMPGGSPQYVLGYGVLNGQVDGGVSAFLLSANVPEPAGAVSIAAVGVTALARRRRRCRRPGR
jgi:hypothetical protein